MVDAVALSMFLSALVIAAYARDVRFPGVIATVLFAALLLSNRYCLVDFGYPLGGKHALYLQVCLLMFCIGGLVGVRWRPWKSAGHLARQRSAIGCRLGALFVCGAAGGVLFAQDIWRNLGGALASSSGNLAMTRTAFLEYIPRWPGRIGAFLYGASLPALIIGLSRWLRSEDRGWRAWALAGCLLSMVVVQDSVAVLAGGRQAVLEQGVAILAVLVYAQTTRVSRARFRAMMAGAIVLCAVAVYYLFVVAAARGEHGGAEASYLLEVCNGEVKGWARPWFAAQSNSTQTLTVAACLYGPYNVTSYAVVFDAVDGAELGLGRWNLLHVTRQLEKLGIASDFVPKMPYTFPGLINWPTAVGSMIVDFGKWGAPLVIAILGVPVGRAFGEWRTKRGDYYSEAFLALSLVFIVHSLMYSPFQETLLLYGLMWLLWFNRRKRL